MSSFSIIALLTFFWIYWAKIPAVGEGPSDKKKVKQNAAAVLATEKERKKEVKEIETEKERKAKALATLMKGAAPRGAVSGLPPDGATNEDKLGKLEKAETSKPESTLEMLQDLMSKAVGVGTKSGEDMTRTSLSLLQFEEEEAGGSVEQGSETKGEAFFEADA